jgi:hypothetical protein
MGLSGCVVVERMPQDAPKFHPLPLASSEVEKPGYLDFARHERIGGGGRR